MPSENIEKISCGACPPGLGLLLYLAALHAS